ncbi:MAG: pyruvate, phosphate dikinase [Bacteroidetes bacterium RIFOXYA12_FULL_35_11]|nr:MAG: pyruvate, phosphate dikinase [Bacteroidetes bacterium GWF2_35_48]OFY79420.1 MAG: pyruvate, phosphate dikinase [Bacteroidetes bacterium RIFOXYA12_FULL_35_11]OFY92782.1 MAG: pyruvate, phosphate dikinase [Bacteroidetes bacterium RIFOXYB2_FULL_35_7]OFY99076.1 MAG: pyruvate, phosphate dikinase [Bacteroidetes bacterium RIFOXYC12_FULL_35_7]HBX53737.1 pyruvate, phosphate dikinase [Bacteroidales bacterium]
MQKFINKDYYERDVYHDLMPFKVKEILLVANLYDAYSIEKEGRFTEHILGEYHKLNLTSLPRITGISNQEDALELMKKKHFDLIILMMGTDKKAPFDLAKKIKTNFPYRAVYLLLNNDCDVALLEQNDIPITNFDKVFVWNGDSKIFFAMVKLLEDKINIENDVKVGVIQAILLVEDSAKYYSRYLPTLYNIILEQTQRLIEDVSSDELYKVLKLRARPKILHASTYEEAIAIYNDYKEVITCVISDVRFPKNGELYAEAGFDFIKHVKEHSSGLPVLLQSSDSENLKKAYELNALFINKNSESLLQDLKGFVIYHLGFGQFVFRTDEGRQLTVAKTMKEFEAQLKLIPDESIKYHALKNHFSLWMMARGEIEIARIIKPYKITDFTSAEELRNFLLKAIQKYKVQKERGKIVNFDEDALMEESNIVSLCSGALGGKGRGLAFVNTLIYNFNFSDIVPEINIRTPKTSIIGTDEFDFFISRNKLKSVISTETNYNITRQKFVEGELSYELVKKLKVFLKHIRKPLAIRSSSLLEDSLSHPFAGVFETYLIPNNNPDDDIRLQQLMTAIKLVFASVFSPQARTYFEAINYKIEDEKMALVIQEVVGNQFGNYYYPHISGTAQSNNYYPVGHMKPDEGFAVIAIGLGQYVVEGEKTFRFSPKYPKIEINSLKDTIKNSQTEFYSINMEKNNPDLMEGEEAAFSRLDLWDAEKHGTIKHCASVYDADSERIDAGIDKPGPRIINFANILKHEYIPLAKTIDILLGIVREAFGSPVEIEFAVDLNKTHKKQPSFYLLQIKPMVGSETDYNIDESKIDKSKVLLFTEKSMGNGKVDEVSDVIYVDPSKFDNSKTLEMTVEIEKLNAKMLAANKKYLLIGPGRWGTRDRFIGIPVVWSHISNAKAIVELSMKDFPLDASLGSHFFHNVTSMNVGYFSVQYYSDTEIIRWDILEKQELVEKTEYFRHVRFKEGLTIIMDGKKRISMVLLGKQEFEE